MPGEDADFAAYVAARWPFLVRSLVLTGLPPAEAEDVAVTGLARCRSGWHGMREVDDVDAQVYGTVYDGRPRSFTPVPVAPVDHPTDADELCQQLSAQLVELPAEQREAVVLRFAGGLDEAQVADVLDVPVGAVGGRVAQALASIEPAALRSEDAFRTAAAAIEVPAPPYDAVVARARQQRRRRWKIGAAVVLAAAVVLGVTAWLTTRPEQVPPPADVVASRNPVDISWYDGRVHLREVTVDLPGLTSLAGIGESVVFIDTDGRVGIVDPAGTVTTVGRSTPGGTVLGSTENGWAAWLEPGDAGARLVVWSVGNAAEVGSITVSPETRLIAIDQDRVYATGDAGTFVWPPTLDEPQQIDEPGLVDVGSATRVDQVGNRIDMVQPFFSVSFERPGEGAMVSPGGNFVLTRVPGRWEPGAPYTPLIYDTRSGDRVPSGIAPDERVVDAAFGNNHQVDYLVTNLSDLQGVDLDGARERMYVLRTCELETNVCSDVAPVRSAGDRAMFAP